MLSHFCRRPLGVRALAPSVRSSGPLRSQRKIESSLRLKFWRIPSKFVCWTGGRDYMWALSLLLYSLHLLSQFPPPHFLLNVNIYNGGFLGGGGGGELLAAHGGIFTITHMKATCWLAHIHLYIHSYALTHMHSHTHALAHISIHLIKLAEHIPRQLIMQVYRLSLIALHTTHSHTLHTLTPHTQAVNTSQAQLKYLDML